jgi:predicted O-methyltransferase YrrM
MINMPSILAYLRHQLKAKNRHGLHSPFVYHLVDEVIYDRSERSDYAEIEKLRQKLLQDQGLMMPSKRSKIYQLIYRLVKEFKPRNILEIGTNLGISTLYLAKAAPSARVITIQTYSETDNSVQNCKSLQTNNIEYLVQNEDHTVAGIISKVKNLDIVFVAADRRMESPLDYFYLCLTKISSKSIMIFEGIYLSKATKEAWEAIKAHPRVTVTIDFFWIGLVFFKEDQGKEHFRIRF